VEQAGIWKPAPGAYAFALETCGVDPMDAMLVAAHPWDTDGATRAGLAAAWTTQLATRVGLPSGGTVRVVVRRHPVTDRMDWFVYPDATIASDGARFRAEFHDVLAALRADTGL